MCTNYLTVVRFGLLRRLQNNIKSNLKLKSIKIKTKQKNHLHKKFRRKLKLRRCNQDVKLFQNVFFLMVKEKLSINII